MMTLFLLLPAFAQPPGPPQPPTPPYVVLIEHADELGLDAAAIAALEDKVEAAAPAIEAQRKALRDAERALMEDLLSTLDEDARAQFMALCPPPPAPPSAR